MNDTDGAAMHSSESTQTRKSSCEDNPFDDVLQQIRGGFTQKNFDQDTTIKRAESKALTNLGFATIDLTGFEQEAPHQSQGGLDDLWHGIKHMAISDETLNDKLRTFTESKMNQSEHSKFDDETKATEKYESDQKAWSISEVYPAPAPPDKPDTPMHDEITKRITDLEKQITEQVKVDMSSADLKRLDQQFQDAEQAYDKSITPGQPLVRPPLGNAIKDFYDRISEATVKVIGDTSK